MAPFDWDRVMGMDPENLEDEAESIFELLAELDVGDESNLDRVKQVFRITQSVMLVKAAEAEVAMEEMEKQAQTAGRSDAKKEQELLDRIAELESENKDLQRFGGGAESGRDTKFLRGELQDLERQNKILQEDLGNLERELANEKKSSEQMAAKVQELEKEKDNLRSEADGYKREIDAHERQLESQRERMMMKRGEDAEYKEKLSKNKRELVEALEEVNNLTFANNKLQEQVDDMSKKMKDAKQEMDRMTTDYMKLKTELNEYDGVMDGLRKDNDLLKAQVSDLMEQVHSKADADDEIMVAVHNKVEEWKQILAEKDSEVVEYHLQVQKLKEQLLAANMDTEKASVAVLSKAVEERDRQVEILKDKLDQATSEIQTSTAVIEDLRDELSKTGRGPSDKNVQRIRELQSKLLQSEENFKDAEYRRTQAEDDAEKKDRDLSEALERMRQYELGEYGLPEAVAEIKEHKMNVSIRDRQIEDLTQQVNKCEMQINDLYDENEELRARLGLDPKEPIDLEKVRHSKNSQHQQDRALNMVLQKEVERLEDERINHKKTIRRLAQQLGQKAVNLGITHDDLMIADGFSDDKIQAVSVAQVAGAAPSMGLMRKDLEYDELKIRNQQLESELDKNSKLYDVMRQENSEFRLKCTEYEDQNKNLEKGMREILENLKENNRSEGGTSGPQIIECPALEKILAAMEAKSYTGQYDTGLHLKARLDNLEGRNDELRRELREARVECTKTKMESEKSQEKLTKYEEDLKALRELGAGSMTVHAVPLPDNMAITSAEVIASLNEHLVQVLQEMSLKEETMKKMEAALENYKRKFALVRHQQGLLYNDYITEKQEWENREKKLKEDANKMEGKAEEDKVRIQEFDRLLDTLEQDEVEVRRRVSEMTRKTTVLRVNEKALTRRYNAIIEMETAMRRENNRLKNDMIQMEKAVTERIGYLTRYKDMATFKIAHLQKALDESVPSGDLDYANKQYNELTEKYRDLLERGNNLVLKSEEFEGMEVEVKRLRDDNDNLKKILEIEKEKGHTFEAALEHLRKQGVKGDSAVSDGEVISISKKITMLEMKEINERERAEHAQRMSEKYKQTVHELENRNLELEQKFAELTRMNLENQKVERELRDELSNCVTKKVSDADRKRITELETIEANMKVEISKLKEVAEVGVMQAKALDAQQVSRDKEVLSLRQQLLDIQAQSDEKTIIGKLHRQIVLLQVSEGTAVRKYEDAQKKIIKLEAQVLQREHKLDEKDQALFHNQVESRSKSKHLKRTIHSLRRQFSGAVPLVRQEKFAKSMVQLQEDKKLLTLELRQVHEQRTQVEDQLAEIQLKHQGLQDLMVTLKDGRGAQKVAEWHGKMEALRLEDLKQKRQNTNLAKQLKFQESVVKDHENAIVRLEEENVRLAKDYEERQLQWEQREVELERIIANMEQTQAEIAGAAAEFESAAGCLPDPTLSLPNQLDQAILTIKRNVKTILEAQSESKVMRKKSTDLEAKVKELDKALTTKDRVIAELRLRMPATPGRDEVIMKAMHNAEKQVTQEDEYEAHQALKIAQSTVGSLQARIAQKDETIQKYQDLLKQAREDIQEMSRRHSEEMNLMHSKVQTKADHAFSKFKQVAVDLINKPGIDQPSNRQLARLNELEDMVAEQDNSLSALTEKLRQSRLETDSWKAKLDQMMKSMTRDKDNLLAEQASEKAKLNGVIGQREQEIIGLNKKIDGINIELKNQKEANARAPTSTMKNLVEKLKNQLSMKEKQHKALSKALMDLRADMVTQAEVAVKQTAEETAAEQNVQKLVNKHTKELQDENEELRGQITRHKKELKKRKDQENLLTSEMEEIKHDLSRKETTITRLKTDKQKLEQEIEELEKKLDRLRNIKQPAPGEAEAKEIDELKRKNRLLEDELKRKQIQAEKPFEHKETKNESETVARWEEGKRWQKTVDRLKLRIKDKDHELEKISKQLEMARNGLERANKDKDQLEMKLKGKPVEDKISAVSATRVMGKPAHNMQDLKKQNYELEEEVSNLKRQLALGRDGAFEDLQKKNRFLTEKLEDLERQTARRALNGTAGSESEQAYRDLLEREQKLHKQLLKQSEENIELKFEVEQANKDIPRLKSRIQDLQNYIDLIKAENANLQGTSRSLGSSSGGLRRLGESGKSNRELEKTIALLKKVVERVQQENERLKKAPGVVSNETLQHLHAENDGLKTQLTDLRQTVGASLTERYESTQRGTAKMMSDYEKLRKDYQKEVHNAEKLQVEKRQLEITKEQLEKEVSNMKGMLEIQDAKRSTSMSGLDSKGWRTAVSTRMYEEKLKSIEADLEKKTSLLQDSKALLRDSAEREQKLIHENEQLKDKVNILENFPSGTMVTDNDLMKQFQQSRLKLERLENEKQELLYEVTRLQQQTGASSTEKPTDDMLHRLHDADKIFKENVDLRVQLKSVQLDYNKSTIEIEKLRKELSNFGPEFFEEIEDLKYNYRESVQKNVQYEDRLSQISEQFGISIKL
ncbi:centrosomal protein of 290 kDa-like [Tubulanus polymorphus]|uniref:centrosomal protein of 290 kDa-like n=1 Tax=Tubulanus polymorphus TaxID=672921 RepID=UPI003DA363F1